MNLNRATMIHVKIEIDNGIFTGANKGLIKYHFELGAGKESFEWE